MILDCFSLGLVAYEQALAWQEALVRQRYESKSEDRLLLLEHPPVFTLGRGGNDRHLLDPCQVPVYRVGRGGDVTFHGPGQLVGYPIIALTHHGRDVHRYLRTLEAVLVETLKKFGLEAHRRDGLTGVWVGKEKIASIGIGVRRWVTYHGFALNVDPDLSYFAAIVPCGLPGVHMTSMAQLLARPVALPTVKTLVAETFASQFGYKEMIWQRNLRTWDSGLQMADSAANVASR